MRRRGGKSQLAGPSQGIDRALTLSQQIQQLQPLTTAEGLADAGELVEQRVLGGAIAHSFLQSSLE